MEGRRILLLIAGWLAVALGAIGLFVPVLPTVPFLLLAAACFSRSSPRLHRWLVTHPRFGGPIRDWNEQGAIRPGAKRLATVTIAGGAVFPLYLVPLGWGARLAVAASLASALVFIWTRPSGPRC